LLLDPHSGLEAPGTICLSAGRIKWLGPPEAEPEGEVYDLPGLLICPGLLDLHVHLRVPGQEHKEDLLSGTRAAVAGGFTAVCAMPNTTPALDRPARLAALQERIAREARCRVYLAGAATVENGGEDLTDFAALREAGCVAITDDAFPLQEARTMGEALRRAHAADLPFLAHLELRHLSRGGVMSAGPVAEELGVAGQDPAAESQALLYWAEAAEGLGRLHLLHLTTADTVDFLRHLRAGPFFEALTAETAPHYLTLTAEAVRRLGASAKMNPPLREERDRQALLDAVRRNVIQVLATDHAPHTPEEKARGLAEAPFGITGLETCVGLVLTHLVGTGHLTLRHAVAKLSSHPARILGVPGGSLEPGQPADLTILDLHKSWTVDPERFQSKGRATPFAGEKLTGKPWGTIVAGHWAMQEGEVVG
jgi:dihydroorotase